ncbi:MAG: FMN-binding protein [Candidatus Izemoplasmatales bacterium]|jgi:uncharacterized protein with FMN-binding domain|nr:FMN-binding protein [bacterium]MDZ4197111.1 FMN-binding protein [Candidatus Izemoplasmatales bacterium]
MSQTKTILFLLIGILSTILLAYLFSIYTWNEFEKEVRKIEIIPVDMMTVQDGTFEGYYSVNLIRVRVSVTVVNHIITSIIVLEHHQSNAIQAEAIIDIIIEEQSIEVDAIAGVTYSVQVIKAAIIDALKKGVLTNDES